MIKEVYVKNFQSHKENTFKFSSGLNLITGSSHNGKSVLIKAISWALRNRPRGEDFKSWFADEKDPVIVKITFDSDAYIIREKSKERNCYIVSSDGKEKSEEVYKALNTDLPSEVSELSNMNDVNIRMQRDDYFLLKDKPGQRAKIINEVVGLSIIDDSLSMGKSILKNKKSELAHTKIFLEEKEVELKKYGDLDSIEKILSNIRSDEKRLLLKEKQIKGINEISDLIEKKEDQIVESEKRLKIKEPVQILFQLIQDFKNKNRSKNELAKIVRKIIAKDEEIKNQNSFLKVQDKYRDISSLLTLLRKKQNSILALKKILISIVSKDKIIKECNIDIHDIKLELEEINICPTCGQEVKDWNV